MLNLPMPPLHLRQSVGVEDERFFENPHGVLAFGDEVPASKYARVFDFGCGCGRVGRQMLLQNENRPSRYIGVDLFRPSVEWCSSNLTDRDASFTFEHINVFNTQLNPTGINQVSLKRSEKFTLVNAHSVFTHITEPNLEFYFEECVNLLMPSGYMRITWFFFNKEHFPMMQDFQNCLYINPDDATNATIYDLPFIRNLYKKYNQRIVDVRKPGIRGHQWVVISANETGADAEFPNDDASFGLARPPVRMTIGEG